MTNHPKGWKRILWAYLGASAAVGFAVTLGLATIAAIPSAEAQTFTVLYTFTGGTADGANPYGAVVLDASGNVYGTTYDGGSGLWCPSGCGTVFKVAPGGERTILHNFAGNEDGAYPYYGAVIVDGTGVYGTTYEGGSFNAGTAWKLEKTGKELTYHFNGSSDGGFPYGGLVRDAADNFYGTTSERGAGTACPYGCGTVFRLDKTGKETVLYSFAGGTTDGAYPTAGVVRDASGNLYGTTLSGGTSNLGTVFKVDSSGHETVLHSFTGSATDGSLPYAGVILDPSGNLYGTTYQGGANGPGTVYKLDPAGNLTVLHSFSFSEDGALPYSGLVRDSNGNLYGTTFIGGDGGVGTVYEVDSNGNESVLYSFLYSTDGGYPYGGLALDAAGALYGTTSEAGDPNCLCGTVFKVTPLLRKKVSGRSRITRARHGAPGEIRTPDLLLRRQSLYPSELRAHSGSSVHAELGLINRTGLSTAALPAVSAASAATTAATSAAITATIFTAPATAFCLGAGFVHVQRASADLGAIQGGNRFVTFFRVGHLYKSESAGAARVAVGQDGDAVYLSVRLKELA